jgi:hypothetical protein
LIQFQDMFGGDVLNQVPMGATIFDAFITVNVQNVAAGATVNFNRMLQSWNQVNATWADPRGAGGFPQLTNGVTPDGIEAASVPDATVPEPGRAGLVDIPLNVDTIQSWANGSLANFGWSIVSDSGSLWAFNSSEAFALGTIKPSLTILYTDPEAGNAGTFSLSVDEYVGNEDPIGGGNMVTVTVNRIGGSTGAVNVNWALSADTGILADVTGATSGVLAFAAGELFKTFNVTIDNDTTLETNETLNITLSAPGAGGGSGGGGVTFGRDQATLRIRDNDFVPTSGDLLLNEIWINSPGNDPPHEFVEIIGDPGIALGSMYYVAIEGLVGDREGDFEKVIPLGDFANGSSGFTLLTPDASGFAFRVPAGTTQIDRLGSIANENVASQNDSTTYILLYSPFLDLTEASFDYDWNNNGSLELPFGVEIIDSVGVPVLDVEDQLYGPGTNRVAFGDTRPEVDAISRSAGNSVRNSGAAWFGGDLEPAGDDYLLYEPEEAFALPVSGAAMTPGEANVSAGSQLVSLTSVTPNANGTVTVTFSASVSQLLIGDDSASMTEGSGITITDTSGVPIGVVNNKPDVAGVGTATWTLSFTGSGVIGGQLPEGIYQLNFVGNGMVGNGRAVDVNNDGSQIDGFRAFQFAVGAPILVGDYNGNGVVDAADYTTWRDRLGQPGNTLLNRDPANGDGPISRDDYDSWKANFGVVLPIGAGGGSAAIVATSEVARSAALKIDTNAAEPIVEVAEVAATPAARDSVFVDLATATSRIKVDRFDAATPRRGAAVGSAIDHRLLLAARRRERANGPERQDEALSSDSRGRFADVDEFFAELGARFEFRSVGSAVRRAS